ncbi:S-DNA-T family DNA segregation ATPase FtsK/SpoIIIE [Oryzihumus leptocrescens]|uniref:S-DNA-T family DNA segregation ATPase FtsK/SpoIIIE n=1 Tax=Oryzihumus leptocrescens TaxID=297536 RepID=A0A542ZEK3_9MICO|nr:S-DNA-T family DNA segregation ATPase FtsK/SpoIIIE [Oryzihumus leptocrescens]
MGSNLAAARVSFVDARAAAALLTRTVRFLRAVLRAALVWVRGHVRWVLALVGFAVILRLLGNQIGSREALVLAFGPALVSAVWATCWPVSYERVCAGPARRARWRRWVRKNWAHLSRECGLSVSRTTKSRTFGLAPKEGSRFVASQSQTVTVWSHPRLMDVTTAGSLLRLMIRTRTGQTVQDLEAAAAPLAAAAGAHAYRCVQMTPSVVEVVLVMQDSLTQARPAEIPEAVYLNAVTLGRRQDGAPWHLTVTGRHTLVVGCSGSGKGSIFWGVCAGLAPAVRAGVVRLWGVDLKRGVEVGVGRGIFSAVATNPIEAVALLTRLLSVLEERGNRMAGNIRLHQPTQADPLHVLAIDELAVLTAYTDAETKKEASRLLAEILTQGRALGVVVLACVQDPRKEVVGLRGLFTQTIALRLRSAEETRMVLGDGMAAVAPAHRISPALPGTAWVVEEDGSTDRVRADWWSDQLVRQVAALHPSPVVEGLPVAPAQPADIPVGSDDVTRADSGPRVRATPASRQRKSRPHKTGSASRKGSPSNGIGAA